MYYAPQKYSNTSISPDVHITTGYIDRSIYEKNPLTYLTFLQTLETRKRDLLEKNTNRMFMMIKKAYYNTLMKHDGNNKHQTNFMICGCDVAVDNSLECKLMEINKGPDLGGKDDTDTHIKTMLIEDTLHQVGILIRDNLRDNFVKI
jgi:hypothetical protein